MASRCEPWPASSASGSPRWPSGSSGPKASGWIAWTGPIARGPAQDPAHRLLRGGSGPEDRKDLAHGDLGAVGAEAIRQALLDQGVAAVPSLRTINRILARRGALDGRGRTRRPPPPPGWYLPDVAAARAELDSFDIVEGLVIKDGPQVEVLNGVSLHGGLVVSWPTVARSPRLTVAVAGGALA